MATTERGMFDEREQQLSAHLAKAGELLRADQTDAAEREIAAAVKLGPGDARAQNLLGLLRFRTGKYEEAYQVYCELVARDTEDSSLRMNLGLVELRMGKNAEAAESLRKVVEREPQHAKAQGYFGLALMRSGELAAAKKAFVVAGQTDLAKQVDDMMSAERGPVAGRLPGTERRAAATGQGPIISPLPAVIRGLEVELPLEPMRASVSRPSMAAAVDVRAPLSLARFVEARELKPSSPGEPFAIVDGLLIVRVEGRLPMRTAGAVVSSGRLNYVPINRRVRGKAADDAFGDGEDALVAATGTGLIVVSPRGGRFTALALATDDVLYLRESIVFAFEESLSWENGRIPGGGPMGMPVVQFRGQGHVVLRSRRAPLTLRLGGAEVLYVDQDALLGWIGPVVPAQLRGVDGEPTQFVSCSGEGALIVEVQDPPPVAAAPAPAV